MRQHSAVQRGQVAINQRIFLGLKQSISFPFCFCITVVLSFWTGAFFAVTWLVWSA